MAWIESGFEKATYPHHSIHINNIRSGEHGDEYYCVDRQQSHAQSCVWGDAVAFRLGPTMSTRGFFFSIASVGNSCSIIHLVYIILSATFTHRTFTLSVVYDAVSFCLSITNFIDDHLSSVGWFFFSLLSLMLLVLLVVGIVTFTAFASSSIGFYGRSVR